MPSAREGIALDGWLAKTVDKLLFRKEPRDVAIGDAS